MTLEPLVHVHRVDGRARRVTIEGKNYAPDGNADALIELPILGFEHREDPNSPGETILKITGMRTRFHDTIEDPEA